MAVAARASSATGPASEAASELGSASARAERHVRGPTARPTGMSPTSSNMSLLSLCYDGGARGIPGRVTCRGRLRLEQRHRVDRDGRDDRHDGVDDEPLRRVGVVRGAAFLGAAGFSVVRREARPAVELDAGAALRRVAAIVAAVGAAAGAVGRTMVRARDLRVRARLAVELAAVLRGRATSGPCACSSSPLLSNGRSGPGRRST